MTHTTQLHKQGEEKLSPRGRGHSGLLSLKDYPGEVGLEIGHTNLANHKVCAEQKGKVNLGPGENHGVYPVLGQLYRLKTQSRVPITSPSNKPLRLCYLSTHRPPLSLRHRRLCRLPTWLTCKRNRIMQQLLQPPPQLEVGKRQEGIGPGTRHKCLLGINNPSLRLVMFRSTR